MTLLLELHLVKTSRLSSGLRNAKSDYQLILPNSVRPWELTNWHGKDNVECGGDFLELIYLACT